MKGIDMKTVYSVIFLFCLIILLPVTPVYGSDWVEFWRFDDGSVFFYNKVNIKHRTKHIVHVWEKGVYSDEGREEDIQSRRKEGLSTEGWDKLSHDLTLYEIDCKKRKYQILSGIIYNTDGSIISSFSFDEPDWDYIPPDTMMDTLRKKVCK